LQPEHPAGGVNELQLVRQHHLLGSASDFTQEHAVPQVEINQGRHLAGESREMGNRTQPCREVAFLRP